MSVFGAQHLKPIANQSHSYVATLTHCISTQHLKPMANQSHSYVATVNNCYTILDPFLIAVVHFKPPRRGQPVKMAIPKVSFVERLHWYYSWLHSLQLVGVPKKV